MPTVGTAVWELLSKIACDQRWHNLLHKKRACGLLDRKPFLISSSSLRTTRDYFKDAGDLRPHYGEDCDYNHGYEDQDERIFYHPLSFTF